MTDEQKSKIDAAAIIHGEYTCPFDNEFPANLKQVWTRETLREIIVDSFKDGAEFGWELRGGEVEAIEAKLEIMEDRYRTLLHLSFEAEKIIKLEKERMLCVEWAEAFNGLFGGEALAKIEGEK